MEGRGGLRSKCLLARKIIDYQDGSEDLGSRRRGPKVGGMGC